MLASFTVITVTHESSVMMSCDTTLVALIPLQTNILFTWKLRVMNIGENKHEGNFAARTKQTSAITRLK